MDKRQPPKKLNGRYFLVWDANWDANWDAKWLVDSWFLSRRLAEHSPPLVEEVKLYEVAKCGLV